MEAGSESPLDGAVGDDAAKDDRNGEDAANEVASSDGGGDGPEGADAAMETRLAGDPDGAATNDAVNEADSETDGPGDDGDKEDAAPDAGGPSDAPQDSDPASGDAGMDAARDLGPGDGPTGPGGELDLTPDGVWAPWESLGGDITGRPAVVAFGGNQLDIVVRQTDRAIYHRRFLDDWIPSKTTFSFLGGPMTGDPDLGLSVNGELDVVARGTDDHVYYKVRNPQTGGWAPSLTEWSDLGGIVTDGPHLAERSTGKRDLVVIGTDLIASRKELDPATGNWSPAFDVLGGPSVVTPTILDVGGKTFLVTMGDYGRSLTKAWTPTSAPAGTDWEDIGGPISSAPAVTSWQAGRLDVVARLPDDSIGYKSWSGTWEPSQSKWTSLGGTVMGRPSIVSWGEGRLDIVARGADGKVAYKYWTTAGGWWPSGSDWASLGDHVGGDPIVVSWAAGRLDVFMRGDDGALWHRARLY